MINQRRGTFPPTLYTSIKSLLKRSAIFLSGLICIRWDRYYKIPRSLKPISPHYGMDRGQPIDRYYIEKFLETHSSDIKGHVLEMGDGYYTQKFGRDKVTKSDVLSVAEGNPDATIVSDLTRADEIDSSTYDCIILIQTLQMIYDFHAALRHLRRMLKPGGVLLATVHGTSKICRREGRDKWGEYWRFTAQSIRKTFLDYFSDERLKIIENHSIWKRAGRGLSITRSRRR